MAEPILFDEHRRELIEASAIDPAVAQARGYRTISRPTANDERPRQGLKRLGIPTWAISEDRYFPGLLIPMYRATGERIAAQWKPRVPVPGRDGKPMKYASVKGHTNRIDVHPFNRDKVIDPTVPLWITEGIKKADALTSRGCCVAAITGVYNWRSGLGTLGDWEDIPLRGRQVIVCFDADARRNNNVLRAMQRLGRWLRSKGAKPLYLIVPEQVPLETITSSAIQVKGVDDWFAAGGTLAQLLAAAVEKPPEADRHGQDTFTDSRMAELVAEQVLADRFVWVKQFGWMAYDGRVWAECSDAAIGEAVRQFFVELFAEQVKAFAAAGSNADPKILDLWRGMLNAGRQAAVIKLCRGLVERKPGDFDAARDLINTPSGVVDLRTGQVEPHDPALLFTKITRAGYLPGATHPDWNRALEAIPEDCRHWAQIRMGQAITGYPPPDDLLVVQQGSGENGKTTIAAAIQQALGGYAILVSHRALLANPDTHPTELMDFYGARYAVLEETPEARRLSVIRLKQTVGTTPMKARRIHKDPVEWDPTHSLFLSTNYLPAVDETDHGTWRRLALLTYPYTFRKKAAQVVGPNDRPGDPGLRERVRSDTEAQRAVLAWLVTGAVTWYLSRKVMPDLPDRVEVDTMRWRGSADRILAFWTEQLIPDPGACILADEMLSAFNEWLRTNGHREWAKETFTPRFAGHDRTGRHGIEQRRVRNPVNVSRWSGSGILPVRALNAQERVWLGVRFRTASDQCGCGACAECADLSGKSLRDPIAKQFTGTSAHSAQVPNGDRQSTDAHRSLAPSFVDRPADPATPHHWWLATGTPAHPNCADCVAQRPGVAA